MNSVSSVLVVDDDSSIRDALCEYLRGHGFAVRGADGATKMDRLLAEAPADVVVLDVMMPGEDGLSVCRRLARKGVPVLMLSALGDTTDRIVGLEIGASDYLPKPFDPRELLARLRAMLRDRSTAEDQALGTRYFFAGWQMDLEARTLRASSGAVMPLTSGEFALLRVFAERPGRLLSRDQLLDLSRGGDVGPYDRAVDLAVSRLRRKLDADGGVALIETVRGEGYRFLPPVRRG
ncbi:MAG TPA: response regulator [Sphingomonadaceae bacterium]|jgi:two-component system OmpR family response regulator|nr:response regulator [Sphingomonadaceae bacterium]